MAKKRSIEEVETSNNSDGVQPKKKKTKKVRSNQCLVILCFCMNKSNFWSFIGKMDKQTTRVGVLFTWYITQVRSKRQR